MEVKIIKETNNELEFEVISEKTILNPLKQKLLEYKEVTYAEWRVEHPLTSNPTFHVKVKKGDTKKIVLKAVKEIRQEIDSLLQQLEEST